MAITITTEALNRLALLKKKRQTPTAVLRIGVRGGGCSGLSYFMDLVPQPEVKDKIFSFGENHRIAIDRKSYLFCRDVPRIAALRETACPYSTTASDR